jgi:hypothetical protein
MLKTFLVILAAIALVRGRNINEAGLNLIKGFEGFRANFYNDSVVSSSLKI